MDAFRQTRIFHIIEKRVTIALWLAMFTSTSGTAALLIAVSTSIYESTGSPLMASAVYGAQWLLPIFAAPFAGYVCGAVPPRILLSSLELIAVIIALAIGWCTGGNFLFLLGFIVIRGLIDTLVKSGRMVALKIYLDPADLETAASLNSTAYILGGGAGALLASLMLGHFTVVEIALFNAGCLLLSGACYAAMGSAKRDLNFLPRPTLSFIGPAYAIVSAHPVLKRNLALLIVVAGVFQGYHTVSRTIFPIDHLGLGVIGPAWVQAVSIAGIVCGALIVAFFASVRTRLSQLLFLLVSATAVCMIATWLPEDWRWSLAIYLFFMLGYEVAFVQLTNEILSACPRENIGVVSVLTNTCTLGSIAAVVLLGGWTTEIFGLFSVAVTLAVMAVLLSGLSILVLSPNVLSLQAKHK